MPPEPPLLLPGDLMPVPRPRFQTNLHNFSFPISKTWGTQRLFRCANINRNGEIIRRPDLPGDESLDKLKKKSDRPPDPVPEDEVGPSRPWNLRKRRAACEGPVLIGGDRSPSIEGKMEVNPRVKFSATLSKEEILEDFFGMTGATARRRPKKRPRALQKMIDPVYPGSLLTEVTVDSYKVKE